ncbi:MAG: hypothetical protein ACP5JM_01935 [Thermoplasmata archaeon]|nr:hypothetical protein [Thermoplasmatales archaeon]
MKLITLFVVMTILLPSGISISENNQYIKISDYNYSISISKFYPMVIINDSKGSFIFAVTRIITSEGDNYQLFNISWEREFQGKGYANVTLLSSIKQPRITLSFIVNTSNNFINVYIILRITNFHGKSLAIIEHMLNNTNDIGEIEKMDKYMNYEFNSMPQMRMKVRDNIQFIMKNGTFYSSSMSRNSSSIMVFSPVNGSIASVMSLITLPVYSRQIPQAFDIYPFIGIAIGIAIIISGAIIIKRRS